MSICYQKINCKKIIYLWLQFLKGLVCFHPLQLLFFIIDYKVCVSLMWTCIDNNSIVIYVFLHLLIFSYIPNFILHNLGWWLIEPHNSHSPISITHTWLCLVTSLNVLIIINNFNTHTTLLFVVIYTILSIT
jgi:hypothetical protein